MHTLRDLQIEGPMQMKCFCISNNGDRLDNIVLEVCLCFNSFHGLVIMGFLLLLVCFRIEREHAHTCNLLLVIGLKENMPSTALCNLSSFLGLLL